MTGFVIRKIIQENRRPGAKITQNSWDNGLQGVHIESRDQIGIHDRPEEELRDPAARVRYLAQYLATYDYIVFPSKRGYGTALQNPERFPITNQFLQSFFAEQLGFKIAAVITNPVRIGGWELHADLEDETARIYDHPKVIIFEKYQKFTQEQLESLIWSPPAWVSQITPREILTLRDGHPVFEPPVSFPLLRWWLAVSYLAGLSRPGWPSRPSANGREQPWRRVVSSSFREVPSPSPETGSRLSCHRLLRRSPLLLPWKERDSGAIRGRGRERWGSSCSGWSWTPATAATIQAP